MVGSLVLHVPPAGVLLSVVVWPWHTVAAPDMPAGMPFTVTVAAAVHPVPVPRLYVMMAVPGPVQIMAGDTTAGLLVLQVPPGVVLVSVTGWPVQ
jgi:hypothetical protein